MASNTRSQKKQDKILQAAGELFMKYGYDAVSLDDILTVVGGSKATLYKHFGGKEGLFVATVESACREKLAPLLAMNVAGLDVKPALQAVGLRFLSIISRAEGRSMFRIVISESERFPQLASHFYSSGPHATVVLLRKYFETWQSKGLLRPGNTEALASQFLGMMMGTFHTKSLLGIMKPLSKTQMQAWVALCVDTFLDGAATKRPARQAK